jgi:cytochrome P450
VKARLGQTDILFLLGPEANRFILQTERSAFSHNLGWGWAFGRTSGPRNLLTMDGAEHRRHRDALHPAFAARRIADYVPRIARVIDRRLDTWAWRGVVDVYEEARVIALDLVAEVLLGFRFGQELTLCRAVYLHGAHKRAGELHELLRRKIAERRSQPTGDALSLAAQARDEAGRPWSEDQILAHADTLLIAGHETTASLAAWTLYLLALHPAYANRIRNSANLSRTDNLLTVSLHHDSFLARVLSEAERLYPPVSTAPRGLARDVVFQGHMLPAGTMTIYSAAATHLLPSVWNNPCTFDPDRFGPPREEHKRTPYALAGFGGGPRTCIGRVLARVELAMLLTRVLDRYAIEVLPGQHIAQRYGITSRPAQGIRVSVRQRKDRPAAWGATDA